MALALRVRHTGGFSEWPVLNSLDPRFLLVQFQILLILLAEDFNLDCSICTSGVPCCS
jgi:hypothetical protein